MGAEKCFISRTICCHDAYINWSCWTLCPCSCRSNQTLYWITCYTEQGLEPFRSPFIKWLSNMTKTSSVKCKRRVPLNRTPLLTVWYHFPELIGRQTGDRPCKGSVCTRSKWRTLVGHRSFCGSWWPLPGKTNPSLQHGAELSPPSSQRRKPPKTSANWDALPCEM